MGLSTKAFKLIDIMGFASVEDARAWREEEGGYIESLLLRNPGYGRKTVKEVIDWMNSDHSASAPSEIWVQVRLNTFGDYEVVGKPVTQKPPLSEALTWARFVWDGAEPR